MEIRITLSEKELELPIDKLFDLIGNRGLLAVAETYRAEEKKDNTH